MRLLSFLSASVVTSIAMGQSPDLLVHFTLDDSGPMAVDVGPNHHSGQYMGGLQGQSGAAPGTRSSVEFGQGNYIEIPTSMVLDQLTNDLSAAAWFFLHPQQTGVARIFGNHGPSGSWSFGVIGGFGLRFTTHGVLDHDIAAPIGFGQWHHVAVTMDAANDVTFYLDGNFVGTASGASAALAPNPTYLIGAFDPSGQAPEFFEGRLDDVQVYRGVLTPAEVRQLHTNPGTNLANGYNPLCCFYCDLTNNSIGLPGSVVLDGSVTIFDNDLQLTVLNLPSNVFGFVLASSDMGYVPNAGGSQGALCLGGSIGRYVGPGQIRNSGGTGSFALRIDLNEIPQPNGFVAVQPGETWNFQAWYRDSIGGMATSNFSNGRTLTFY